METVVLFVIRSVCQVGVSCWGAGQCITNRSCFSTAWQWVVCGALSGGCARMSPRVEGHEARFLSDVCLFLMGTP